MTVFSNLICYRYRWGREYIQPRASKRYLKSRAILDDRAFQAQITGDQPDRNATMSTLSYCPLWYGHLPQTRVARHISQGNPP